MADYLRDFREIVGRSSGSAVKRSMLLKRLDKFARECRKHGADVNKFPQGKFVEALCSDGHGDFGEMMFRFCQIRMFRGDYSDWTGWEYRDEWAISSYRSTNKRWRLEPVGSLAVLGEQGIGDELMFQSVLPEVIQRVPRVVVECDPRLVGIVSRSFGIEARPRQNLNEQRGEEVFIPLGDLPRLFRKSLSSFPGTPYVSPLPEMVQKWSHLKGRTGLAWRSRTGNLDPKSLGVENPVCLQYDAWDYETEGMEVPDCDLRNDIEDLLGICANLERVVSVPQTIVHIAGGVGLETDVVLAPVDSGRVKNQIPWRYGAGMPWYQNTKVYNSLNEYLHSRPRAKSEGGEIGSENRPMRQSDPAEELLHTAG